MDALPPKCEVSSAFASLSGTFERMRLWWQTITSQVFFDHVEIMYRGGQCSNGKFVNRTDNSDTRVLELRKWIKPLFNQHRPIIIMDKSRETRRIEISIAYQFLTKDDCSILSSCMREIVAYAGLRPRRVVVPLLPKVYMHQHDDNDERRRAPQFLEISLSPDNRREGFRFENPAHIDKGLIKNVELSATQMTETREKRMQRKRQATDDFLRRQLSLNGVAVGGGDLAPPSPKPPKPKPSPSPSVINTGDKGGGSEDEYESDVPTRDLGSKTCASVVNGQEPRNDSGVFLWH